MCTAYTEEINTQIKHKMMGAIKHTHTQYSVSLSGGEIARIHPFACARRGRKTHSHNIYALLPMAVCGGVCLARCARRQNITQIGSLRAWYDNIHIFAFASSRQQPCSMHDVNCVRDCRARASMMSLCAHSAERRCRMHRV